MCFLQLSLQSSDLLLLIFLLLHSEHLVLVLQPDELFPEQSHKQSQYWCKLAHTKKKENKSYVVYYLYSIGINSAARLSWLGLAEGISPTWKDYVQFRNKKCHVDKQDHCFKLRNTCLSLGELVLLSLSASQLLIELLQRISFNDDPLGEGMQIQNNHTIVAK